MFATVPVLVVDVNGDLPDLRAGGDYSSVMTRSKADKLNAEGNELCERGDHDAALLAYEKAAALDPTWATPWFNIGLLHKERRQWSASLAANAQALERKADYDGARWNLGIAATAMGDWALARKAWAEYGIELPPGEGPIRAELGLTPVRVDVNGNPEVVWGQRIDPCRIVIDSIPFRSCGRRYQDLVLHDGAPNGTRRLGDREVPVFDELQLLTASPWDTFEAEIVFPDGALAALQRLATKAGGNAEDWTRNTRILCKACSEGRPDHDAGHNHEAGSQQASAAHRVAIAAKSREHAIEILQAWEAEVEGIDVEWLDDGYATDSQE